MTLNPNFKRVFIFTCECFENDLSVAPMFLNYQHGPWKYHYLHHHFTGNFFGNFCWKIEWHDIFGNLSSLIFQRQACYLHFNLNDRSYLSDQKILWYDVSKKSFRNLLMKLSKIFLSVKWLQEYVKYVIVSQSNDNCLQI